MTEDTPTSQCFPDPAVAARWAGRQLTIEDVYDLLPHRPPFLLVDRVLEVEPGERAVALKLVSINEWFFPGHYPGHPIMPGMLILEALAQVGGIVMLTGLERGKLVPYFTGVKEARFRQPVRPGDALRLEAAVERTSFRFGRLMTRMNLKATVDGDVVAEAVCSFALVAAGE